MSDTINALSAPIRPGAQDVRGQQSTLLPFDAFVFDDPNRVAAPKLRLKAPWELISTGLEVYEDGVDQDNFQDGDRRLIVEGEVLKLQHYVSADSDWEDDISLGGYDGEGNFMEFLIAKGILREDSPMPNVEGGFAVPILKADYQSPYTDQTISFANLGGKDLHFGETDVTGIEESSLTWEGNPTYKSSSGIVYFNTNSTVSKVDPEKTMKDHPANGNSSSLLALRFACLGTVQDAILARVTSNVQFSNVGGTSFMRSEIESYLEIVSGVLQIRHETETFLPPFTSQQTNTFTDTLIASLSADTFYSVAAVISPDMSVFNTTSVLQFSSKVNGYHYVDGTETYFSHADSLTATTYVTATEAFTNYSNYISCQMRIRETECAVTDLLNQTWAQDPLSYTSPSYVDPNSYREELTAWSAGTEYWSYFNTDTDIVFSPKPAGRTLIFGGTVIDSEKDLVITGPIGATGATGETGEAGPAGAAITPLPYNSVTSYATDEFCIYNGIVYISTIDSNLGNQPDTNYPDWSEWNWNDLPIGFESFVSTGSSIPSGWLVQNGGTYNKVDYPELYAFLGSGYSVDTLTFKVPDKQGISIVGRGTQSIDGSAKGDSSKDAGDLLNDQMQQITGNFVSDAIATAFGARDDEGAFTKGTTESYGQSTGTSGNANAEHLFDSATSPNARTGLYTRGPAMVVDFVIKARSVKPLESTDISVDSRLGAVEANDVVQDGRLDDLEDGNKPRKFVEIMSSGTRSVTVVRDENDELWGWGGNSDAMQSMLGTGQAANGGPFQIPHPNDVDPTATIIDQGCLESSSWRLYSDGSLYFTGKQSNGHFGIGNTTDQYLWVRSTGNYQKVFPPTFINYDARSTRMIVQDTDGDYWAAGRSENGEFGTGTSVATNSNWVALSWIPTNGLKNVWHCGGYEGFAFWSLEDGTIRFSGRNINGVSGNGTTASEITTQIDVTSAWGGSTSGGLQDIRDILMVPYYYTSSGVGVNSVLMWRNGGSISEVWTCGDNRWGQIGNSSTTDISTPHCLMSIAGGGGEYQIFNIAEVGNPTSGRCSFYVREVSGKVWRWGHNSDGQLGTGNLTTQTAPYNSGVSSHIDNNCSALFDKHPNNFTYPHTKGIFLKDSRYNRIWATGDNNNGNLGIGNATANISTFTPVYTTEDIIDIKGNGYGASDYITAITTNGRVLQWGYATRQNIATPYFYRSTDKWIPMEISIP